LPDTGAASSAAPAAAATSNDMPALPDAGAAAAPAKAAASNDMPALPDAGAAPAAAGAAQAAASNDMPALPDAGGAAAAKPAAGAASSSDMPALPDAGGAAPAGKPAATASAASGDMPALTDGGAASASGPTAAASPTDSDMNAVPMDDGSTAPKPVHESKPWLASKERPKTIFGGWIHAKGGNITSRLSWASQQVLNALDANKYKMANEEGVYEGEQNKGPQYRKFTFNVPKTKDTVLVLLKESKGKVWLRVGPDEEPAPADHTYAQVAKIRAEDQKVLAIIKKKFGSRAMPHRYLPSWDAPFDRHKETADE
jgi:hypothetical protein